MSQPQTDFMSHDQRQLLSYYIHMYNRSNNQIDRLMQMQRDVHNSINNIVNSVIFNSNNSNSNSNRNRNRNNRTSTRHTNHSTFQFSPRQSVPLPVPSFNPSFNPPFNPPFNPLAQPFVPTNNNNNNIFSRSISAQEPIFRPFFENVTVAPTQSQINNATRLTRFIDIVNPINSNCPISLEPFDPNMQVLQIIYCQHIFNPSSLSSWFRANVRCPICRYDIREYPVQGNTESPNQSDETNNTQTDTSPNSQSAENNNTVNSNNASRTATLQINTQFVNNYEQFQDQVQQAMEDMVHQSLTNSNDIGSTTSSFNIIAGVTDPSFNEINQS